MYGKKSKFIPLRVETLLEEFFHPEREANKKEQKLFPFGNIDTYIFTKHLIVVVAVVLFYIHGKNLRSCRDGQLT